MNNIDFSENPNLNRSDLGKAQKKEEKIQKPARIFVTLKN